MWIELLRRRRKIENTFPSRSETDLSNRVYIHRLSMPTKLPIRSRLLRFISLVFSNTCTCSFDLEQTSLSFTLASSLFSMFVRCLVHESVAPTFRRGVGSLQFEGPRACDAVSQVSSTGRQTKKGAKREGGREEIWGYKHASGRNSRTNFLDSQTLGRRILTPVSR